MKAIDRLNAAHRAALGGRFEEALSEFVWFHNHALEEEPALYGVRLSFALGYWMELAENYPQAKETLVKIRDEKAVALGDGKGDRALFHDVVAINEALGCPAATYVLFCQLDRSDPELAAASARLALAAIVGAGDFLMAGRYLPEPESRINQLSDTLNNNVEKLKSLGSTEHDDVTQDAYVHIYASEVQLIVSVLEGLGHLDEASRLKSVASELVNSACVQKAVRAAIEPNGNEWFRFHR